MARTSATQSTLDCSTNIRAFSNAIFFCKMNRRPAGVVPSLRHPPHPQLRVRQIMQVCCLTHPIFFDKVHAIAMEIRATVVNRSKMMTTMTPMSARTMTMAKKVRCAGEKVPGRTSSAMKTSQVSQDQWQCGARYSFRAGSNIFPPLITFGNSIIRSTLW